MKLFVGLGNPGAEYAFNRHNVGFMAVDAIATAQGFPAWRKRFQGVATEGRLGRAQVMLLKPLTYMNESGQAVRPLLKRLDIDDLHIEDAMSIGQRPRIEIAGDRVFAVLKVLDYVEPTSDVETGQIAVWVGPSYVLSVRLGDPGDLTALRAELEADSHLLSMGPLAVLHGILDLVVDGYQLVADELARDIEQIEERVFSPERTDDAAIIYKLKRENLEVRRAVDPLRPDRKSTRLNSSHT